MRREGTEWAGMFTHPRNFRVIQPGSHRDDQLVVVQNQSSWANARTESYGSSNGIYRLNVTSIKACPRRHPSDGRNNMVERDRARDYFRKQWLENDIVFAIDQSNLGSFELVCGEDPAEMHCDINAAESTA